MGNDCYIYLTTNLINGKKYIGSRDKTLTKGYGVYLDSGVNLKLAIKKYGRENFKKEILEECNPKFDYANITNCCKGKLKTSAGYIWKYK